MIAKEAAAWLRRRANDYSRDASALRRSGHVDDALIYEAIRDELRGLADHVEAFL